MIREIEDGFAQMSDGCRIFWRLEGAGNLPIVMLSNSLGTHMDMWSPQMETLGRHCRVLRYDSRGHGRSDVPATSYGIDRLGRDALELLDALGLACADFCGLSMGGMVGQWLGIHAGDRLNRLIVANSSAYMGPPSAWHDRIALVRRSGMQAIAGAVTERWFTPAFRAERPEAVARIETMLLETDPEGYCGSCAAIADMDMRPLLHRIATRSLIIGGNLDPATPPEHARLMAQSIAESRLIELTAAHLSNVELPEAFTAAILDFLAD